MSCCRVTNNDDRLKTLEKRAKGVDTDLGVLPEMINCAAEGKIYHQDDDTCVTAKAAHCFRIGWNAATAMAKVVNGGILVNKDLCSFNRHFGGEKCLSQCGAGYVPSRIDPATGKKVDKAFDKNDPAMVRQTADGTHMSSIGVSARKYMLACVLVTPSTTLCGMVVGVGPGTERVVHACMPTLTRGHKHSLTKTFGAPNRHVCAHLSPQCCFRARCSVLAYS